MVEYHKQSKRKCHRKPSATAGRLRFRTCKVHDCSQSPFAEFTVRDTLKNFQNAIAKAQSDGDCICLLDADGVPIDLLAILASREYLAETARRRRRRHPPGAHVDPDITVGDVTADFIKQLDVD